VAVRFPAASLARSSYCVTRLPSMMHNAGSGSRHSCMTRGWIIAGCVVTRDASW